MGWCTDRGTHHRPIFTHNTRVRTDHSVTSFTRGALEGHRRPKKEKSREETDFAQTENAPEVYELRERTSNIHTHSRVSHQGKVPRSVRHEDAKAIEVHNRPTRNCSQSLLSLPMLLSRENGDSTFLSVEPPTQPSERIARRDYHLQTPPVTFVLILWPRWTSLAIRQRRKNRFLREDLVLKMCTRRISRFLVERLV